MKTKTLNKKKLTGLDINVSMNIYLYKKYSFILITRIYFIYFVDLTYSLPLILSRVCLIADDAF